MSDAALEAKNKGNAAFSKGDFKEAIKWFTEAISHDPKNHVLYSNRSAAHSSLKNYSEALKDAEKTIEIKPDWAKGYSRKGAACHGLGEFPEAITAYKKGLELEPSNEQIKQGLADAEKAAAEASNPMNMFGQLFGGDIWTKIRMNPTTASYLSQPDFVSIVTELQQNPSSLAKYKSDPRVMQLLGVLIGMPASSPREEAREEAKPEPKPAPKEEPKAKEPEPEPMKVDLTPEQQKAEEAKNRGNEAYKSKDFETAIKCYNEAMELDPNNVTYLLNRAAVYLEQSKVPECVEDCNKAIEIGRKQFIDYTVIAKALVRIGNAHMKVKDYGKAVDAYNQALTEHRTAATLNLLKKAEKLKEEADKAAYLDPQKAAEAKERGNQLFKDGKIPEAIKEYTEAMARNPSDYTLWSNRAACYTKLGEYPLGLKDCDTCISMKPDFVKAYTRKGHIQYFMKEYQKALETYDQGLKYEENNAELQEGIKRTLDAMRQQEMKNQQGGAPDKETLERAMRDPEVQEILSDPVMRQILEDMQSDPKAAQDHLRNPIVMKKIQKLVSAGVLRLG